MEQIQQQADSRLITWFKTHLGALCISDPGSGEETNFSTLFDSTFSENAIIRLDHKLIPREAFETKLKTLWSPLSRPSTIEWKEMLEVATEFADSGEATTPAEKAIVAGFFVVTRSMKWKVRAAPAQRLSSNSFSAQIVGEGDQTRITELFLTSFDRPAPIYLHGI